MVWLSVIAFDIDLQLGCFRLNDKLPKIDHHMHTLWIALQPIDKQRMHRESNANAKIHQTSTARIYTAHIPHLFIAFAAQAR